MRKQLCLVLVALVVMVVLAVESQAAIEVPSVASTQNLSVDSYTATLPLDKASWTGFSLSSLSFSCNTTVDGSVGDVLSLIPNSGSNSSSVVSGTSNLTGVFDIVINPGSGLLGNTAALAAFNRAAELWEARISDPITVTIDADMSSLPSGVIGSTTTVFVESGYSTVRDLMVSDAMNEPDDTIAQLLPTAAQFTASVPSPIWLNGNIMAAKANLKALGVSGLDDQFGASDADISFSTQFAFDFDKSNGITPGTMDFESIAAHEIGHALGFVSIIDPIDFMMGFEVDMPVDPLDLFQFQDGTMDPETLAEFTTTTRCLVPNVERNTDQIDGWGTLTADEIPMSTGYYNGDGRQASHWKDDMLTGNWLGIMDPTFDYGDVVVPMESDFRALDLIGYEISPVPEPSVWILFAFATVLMAARSRPLQ